MTVLAHKSDSALRCAIFLPCPTFTCHYKKKLILQRLHDPVTQLPVPEGSAHSGELADIPAADVAAALAVLWGCLLSHIAFGA